PHDLRYAVCNLSPGLIAKNDELSLLARSGDDYTPIMRIGAHAPLFVWIEADRDDVVVLESEIGIVLAGKAMIRHVRTRIIWVVMNSKLVRDVASQADARRYSSQAATDFASDARRVY